MKRKTASKAMKIHPWVDFYFFSKKIAFSIKLW